MALEQKLNLRLSQRLVMTPSLQQAIKLLQLSRLELGDTLAQEILENPLLDVDAPPDEAEVLEKEPGMPQALFSQPILWSTWQMKSKKLLSQYLE